MQKIQLCHFRNTFKQMHYLSTRETFERCQAEYTLQISPFPLVTSNYNDVNSVNGGGLMEEPVKSAQTSALNNEKWSTGRKTLGQKNRDNSTWKLESEGNRSHLFMTLP